MKARYDHLNLPAATLARVRTVAETLVTIGGYRGTPSDAITDAVTIIEALDHPLIDLTTSGADPDHHLITKPANKSFPNP